MPPKTITESALMEVKIPFTNMYAPFIVVGLMAGAIIGGGYWIYQYNLKREKGEAENADITIR